MWNQCVAIEIDDKATSDRAETAMLGKEQPLLLTLST